MASQQPTYLPQGVNYVGFLSQQLGDLTGKTTLAHELIQNADDAKDDSGRLAATRITFGNEDVCRIELSGGAFMETPPPGTFRDIMRTYARYAEEIRKTWDSIHGGS